MHEVVELERSLWDPACRNDPEHVDRLLHPDYVEVGSSGRTWARHEILEPVGHFVAKLTDFARAELAADVQMVTYVSVVSELSGTGEVVGRPVKRTSVWLHRDGRWLLRYHQGTPGLA